MSATQLLTTSHEGPELVWLGEGAWVACDAAAAEDDPRRVIAYVECKDHLVYVLWARDRSDVRTYETIREAMQDIAATMASRTAGGDA